MVKSSGSIITHGFSKQTIYSDDSEFQKALGAELTEIEVEAVLPQL